MKMIISGNGNHLIFIDVGLVDDSKISLEFKDINSNDDLDKPSLELEDISDENYLGLVYQLYCYPAIKHLAIKPPAINHLAFICQRFLHCSVITAPSIVRSKKIYLEMYRKVLLNIHFISS